MYSFEIGQYIDDRNHELNSYEIMYITDVERHNQISGVRYDKEEHTFYITTKDEYHFWFKSALEKQLIYK